MVMGLPSLIHLFDESTHADLPGGILESFGRLLKNDLRLFVYPMLAGTGSSPSTPSPSPTTCSRSTTTWPARQLRGLDNFKPDYLPILSRDVLKRIPTEDSTWESMVPSEVGELIRRKGFFGYQRAR
jgi:hypothetical protein